ncbi:MAG: SDR family NAD(P)-dependent oxidoreductase [Acidimicrobiales bacterium]
MPRTWTSALVTGASSGIGREIALILAGEGTRVVAVARDRQRLEALAKEVTEGAIEVLAADLADPEQLATVEARAADVDLLVNNAGFGTYGDFVRLPVDGEEREIKVNVLAVVRLTHAALGPMLERDRGTILNVSSVAGLQSTPGNATYGATKAFVTSFSEAVHEEVRGTGVQVSMVLPGFTRTEFQERAGIEGRKIPDIAWMDATTCARIALDGARAGKPFNVPGGVNKALVTVTGFLPRSLVRRVAARMTRRL